MRHLSTSFLVHLALASMLTMTSSGCTTVQVTKVHEPTTTSWTFWLNPLNLWDELTDSGPAEPDTKAKGVRYFLPKPYLLVTPLPEGKMDVSVVYVPDPDQEYAVDTHVYIASQDIHLVFAGEDDAGKGLLSKVTYDSKDPAVYSEIVKGAGTMGKEIIDAKKAAKDAREQQRQAALAKLDGLQEDERKKQVIVDEKEYALKVANDKLTRFKNRNPADSADKQSEKDALDDEVAKATHELTVAKADLEKAAKAVKDFTARNPSASTTPADMAPLNRSVTPEDGLLPGPTLFEIKEGRDGASLMLQMVKTEGSSTVSSYPNFQMKLKTFMPLSNKTQGEGEKLGFANTPPTEPPVENHMYRILFQFSKPFNKSDIKINIAEVNTGEPEFAPLKLEKHLEVEEGNKKLTLLLPPSEFGPQQDRPRKWIVRISKGKEEFKDHHITLK